MAIKIIKPGKKKIAVYRATCVICGCEFEFNKEDGIFGEDRDGKYIKLHCPECNNGFYSYKVNPCRYDIIENMKEE